MCVMFLRPHYSLLSTKKPLGTVLSSVKARYHSSNLQCESKKQDHVARNISTYYSSFQLKIIVQDLTRFKWKAVTDKNDEAPNGFKWTSRGRAMIDSLIHHFIWQILLYYYYPLSLRPWCTSPQPKCDRQLQRTSHRVGGARNSLRADFISRAGHWVSFLKTFRAYDVKRC